MWRKNNPTGLSITWMVGIAIAGVVLAGCAWIGTPRTSINVVPGGNPREGQLAMARYGCGSCHVIPGLVGADSHVGPPLDHFARRSYVGGVVPNTVDNLVLWIQSPQVINPQTAMPPLGVTEQDALHMAAYLYTLD
jgi:cytochrome c